MNPFKLIVFFILIINLNSKNGVEQFTSLVKVQQKNYSPTCTQKIYGLIYNNKTKMPISNALISVLLDNEEIKLTRTNEKGEYSLQLNCNTKYRIIVTAKKYFNSSYKFKTSNQKNETIFKTLSLDEECYQTINGKIINELSKKTIDKAVVTLYLNGVETKIVNVAADGIYNFKLKCNSNYSIKAYKLDFIANTYTFSTTNTKIITHDFILKPECIETISGKIFNKKSNEPISAKLKLYLNNIEVKTLKVGNNGSYYIKFQCTTNYKIVASKANYKSDSYYFLTNYLENKQPNYFHLKKDLFLEENDCKQLVFGEVFDKKTHSTSPNSTVSLWHQNQEIKTFKTNNKGTYSFKVNCNLNYQIKAQKDNKYSKILNFRTSSIKNSSIIQNIYIGEKNCTQIIQGVVFNKETKLPLDNTQIYLFENTHKIQETSTKSKGNFFFNVNCNSKYKIITNHEDYKKETINLPINNVRNTINSITFNLSKKECWETVSGFIKENISNKPLANITVVLLNNSKKEIKQILTDNYGAFHFEIKCHKKYTIQSKKLKYTEAEVTVYSTNKTSSVHNVNLFIEPNIQFKEKNGAKYIETKSYIFELDKYDLSNEVKAELNKVIFNMNQNPAISIEVNYHTDSRGPDKYNLELTINRANTTKNYLTSKGINPSRIFTNGYGETRILNKCVNNVKCTNVEHALNRRVEFIVLKK